MLPMQISHQKCEVYMGRLVEIKLCPFRAHPDPFTGIAKFEECFEEKCMLYDPEHKRCGLTVPLHIDDKKKD